MTDYLTVLTAERLRWRLTFADASPNGTSIRIHWPADAAGSTARADTP
ncbi:MAG: hypothetical protein HY778_04280 [Betaproteobacteria bacterium]|nr:hypothetical protein [Betaproteobacteria bacterium]